MSTHSGQIAFPGGRVDPHDVNMAATALRETQEEVGLQPQYVEIIGELPVYVTGSAFHVTPVVALVSPGFQLSPNAAEVQDVFEVPLAFLMDPANHRRHAFEVDGSRRQWFSMPYLDPLGKTNGDSLFVERYIWGATAAMLRNFYRFLVVNPAK